MRFFPYGWALFLLLSMVQGVSAAGKIALSPDAWVSLGAGMRVGAFFTSKSAPNGSSVLKTIGLRNARLYVNAKAYRNTYVEFNTERDAGNADAVRVLDAVVKYEPTEAFNVWVGRFLPPSDRNNLSGPFFQMMATFPLVSAFPSVFAGRDDGLAFWGELLKKKFKYQVGVFEGTKGVPNLKDNPLYAARVVYSFLDSEPGYYNSNTYYGEKNLLTVGLTYQGQAQNAGTLAAPKNFRGFATDLLFEHPFSNGGVITLGGGTYDFDFSDGTNPAQGKAYYGELAYLLPQKLGSGRLQPAFRLQRFDGETAASDITQSDFALNYIVHGHNARVQLQWSQVHALKNTKSLNLLGQLQF